MDRILPFSVPLSPSSCPSSYWMPPNLKIREMTRGELIFGWFGPFWTTVRRSSTARSYLVSWHKMLQHCMIIDSNNNNNKTKECGSYHERVWPGSAVHRGAASAWWFCLQAWGVALPGAVRTMRLWEQQEVQFCSKNFISNSQKLGPKNFRMSVEKM